MTNSRQPLLEVRDLCVDFAGEEGPVHAVRGVDLELEVGQTVALVGESGSGKSVTALSLMRLVDAQISAKALKFAGLDLLHASAAELGRVRGARLAMVFQDPMTSLNPVLSIGRQLQEVLSLHQGLSVRAARSHAIELLQRVGIPDPTRRVQQYPHELSGGMKQRVMIAMAVAGRPRLLIADEPTTALDVTIQAQIMDLLASLQREFGMAMLLITHDLAVVAQFAERVAVMYAGRIVEQGTTRDLFKRAAHPYTRALLAAVPDPQRPKARLEAIAGRVPPATSQPQGCAFAPRCRSVFAPCLGSTPPSFQVAAGHLAACFLERGAPAESAEACANVPTESEPR